MHREREEESMEGAGSAGNAWPGLLHGDALPAILVLPSNTCINVADLHVADPPGTSVGCQPRVSTSSTKRATL